jgi:hypothetical protein
MVKVLFISHKTEEGVNKEGKGRGVGCWEEGNKKIMKNIYYTTCIRLI